MFRSSRCSSGTANYWNKRPFTTSWKPPPGVKVVWVGERIGEGTGIRVSVRMVPPAQGGKQILGAVPVKIFFTLNNGHWFRHPRGTLLVTLVQLTLALWVFEHFRAAWTTIYSFSVSLVVMVSQMS